MDNNLPKDPPDSGDNNSPSSDPVSEAHSEVASRQRRDSHGRFTPEHQEGNVPPNTPNSPNPPIQVTQGGGGSGNGSNKSEDDPLFEAKVNNPFSKFFNWIKRLIKNEGINIKIKPLTAVAMVIALTGGGGIIGGVVGYAFPHSSPILHREVAYQGNLQKTSNGIFLILPNSDKYTLRPKISSMVDFQNLSSGQVFVKGNLTPENFVIEVSEIIPLGVTNQVNPTSAPIQPNVQPATNSGQTP